MSGGKASLKRRSIRALVALECALLGNSYNEIANGLDVSVDDAKKTVLRGLKVAGIRISLHEARAQADEMLPLIAEARERVRGLTR